MNWQYLKYFEVVAKEQHFTRAAQKLYITTSALSRAIASLEDELHVPLFTRNGRNVYLTNYGTVFLEYVQKATRTIEDGYRELNQLSHSVYGTVTISSIMTYAESVLPPYIHSFAQKYPDVTFTVLQEQSQVVLQNVVSQSAELGFLSDHIDWDKYPMIGKHPVLTEDIVLIVPEGHPLSKYSSVPLEKIKDESFICFSEKSSIYYHFVNLFKERGYTYRTNMRLTDDYSVASMVRNGMGIALIPIGNSSISKDGLSVIRIEDDLFKRNIYMIWRNDNTGSYASQVLREEIINSLSEVTDESETLL